MGMSLTMMMLLVMGGGGGNELLDFIPSQVFWKLEGVPFTAEAMLAELGGQAKVGDVSALLEQLDANRAADREEAQKKLIALGPGVLGQVRPLLNSKSPEVAGRAKEIVRTLSAKGEHKDVRRLMAIRSLGELKHIPAAAALTKLINSEELFVAEYARGALAAIAGKTLARPTVSPAQRKKDLELLPKTCQVVGQFAFTGEMNLGTIDLKKILAQAARIPGGHEITEDKIVEGLFQRMLLPAAGMVGNVRIDLVTMGFAIWNDENGRERGYVVFLGRGKYDREKLKALILKAFPRGSDRAATAVVKGVDVYRPERGMALMFPSNELAVFMAGPRSGEDLPVQQITAALKSGKGTLAENKDLAALMATVDTTAPLWAVAKLTDDHRKADKVLAPFASATGVAKLVQGKLEGVVTARVGDKEKLQAALDEINDTLAKIKRELPREVERMPALKPLADLANSIQVTQKPGEVSITGQIKLDSPGGVLLLPLLALTAEVSREMPMPAPADAVEVRPAVRQRAEAEAVRRKVEAFRKAEAERQKLEAARKEAEAAAKKAPRR